MSDYEQVSLRLATATTEDLVTCKEMKDWLKVDEDETADDAVIDGLIDTAIEKLEVCYQRSFIHQTYEYTLDCFPDYDDPIRPPRSPLVSVASIRYFETSDLTDTGGTVWSSTEYYVDTKSEPGRIYPVNVSWPTGTRTQNVGIVQFVAGYSSTPAGVPDQVKADVKQLVARLYEHRGDEEATKGILAEYDKIPNELSLPEWG